VADEPALIDIEGHESGVLEPGEDDASLPVDLPAELADPGESDG
jgi:hypothetical protein